MEIKKYVPKTGKELVAAIAKGIAGFAIGILALKACADLPQLIAANQVIEQNKKIECDLIGGSMISESVAIPHPFVGVGAVDYVVVNHCDR